MADARFSAKTSRWDLDSPAAAAEPARRARSPRPLDGVGLPGHSSPTEEAENFPHTGLSLPHVSYHRELRAATDSSPSASARAISAATSIETGTNSSTDLSSVWGEPTSIRITVGTPKEIEAFLDAFAAVLRFEQSPSSGATRTAP